MAAQRTFYGYNDMADAKALLSPSPVASVISTDVSTMYVSTHFPVPTMTTAGSGVKVWTNCSTFANRMSPRVMLRLTNVRITVSLWPPT